MLKKLLFGGQLSLRAQVLAALAGVMLFAAITQPLWQMTMISNQYPEGLRMQIYPSTLKGDLQEINTLNHYIGMGVLDAANFRELQFLPLAFGALGLLCLLVALLHRRWLVTLALVLVGLAGLAAMGILLYRLYSYGHTLDPRAPIDVPPFMPPPIGTSKLANFHVTTFLHLGSALFILAMLDLALALWISRPRAGLAPAKGQA